MNMLGRLRTRVLGAGRAEHTVGAAMTLLRQAAPPRAPDEAPHRRPPIVLSPAHDKWSAPGAKAQYSAIIPAHRVASGATTADKSHLLRCVGKLIGHSNRRLSRAFTDGKQAGGEGVIPAVCSEPCVAPSPQRQGLDEVAAHCLAPAYVTPDRPSVELNRNPPSPCPPDDSATQGQQTPPVCP